MKDLLDLFSTQDTATRFCLFALPGFLALAAYDLRVPGEKRKYADQVIALVAYSVLLDVIAFVFLRLHPIALGDTWWVVGFATANCVLLPLAAGWFAVDFRNALARRGLVLSPVPKSWDFMFGEIAHLDAAVAIIATLSDGRRVGGFWDRRAFASSFPAEEDLFIPAPCEIDQETGEILRRITGGRGLLIRHDDVLTLEVFDADALVAVRSPGEPEPEIRKEISNTEYQDGE